MGIFKKIWHLLTRDQRRAAIMLLGLMLIGMLLETLGIGLVIPALALMTQGDIADKYPAVAPWLAEYGNPSHEQLVVFGMLILAGVYTVKALFLSFLAWKESRFIYGVRADLSQRMFIGYLRQPYTFHLQRNSAQLIRNVINETNLFTNTGLNSGMVLLTEILVLLGILALLIAVEPVGALAVMTVLGFVGWSFTRVTRRHILRWGVARQMHEGSRIQHLQQGLGGAKDVKLLGRESDFLDQYQLHNEGSASAGQREAMLKALPRFWLEFLAVAGLAALVLIMVWRGKPLEALLPMLGLFAAAAFRLMPSVNRVLGAVQSTRYSLPVVDLLHSELCLLNEGNSGAPAHGKLLPFENSLTLDQVVFGYPSVETSALRGVSIKVSRGTSVGFIGGSGAGKSTLVDIVLGLLTPLQGSVKVDDVDIQSDLRGWQDQIGYVPQAIYLTDDTLRRNVAFGLPVDQIEEEAVWRAIRAAQLEQFVHELPQGLDTMVGERGVRLSGGQRQRIGIARALYNDPPVLVLDEATSSLDVDTERGIMDAVRAFHGEKTIIIVAHRLSTVEGCDYIYRLGNGLIIDEGETRSILGNELSLG